MLYANYFSVELEKRSFWVPVKGESIKNLSMDFVLIQRILGSQTVFQVLNIYISHFNLAPKKGFS